MDGARKTILLVEDEVPVALDEARELQKEGYAVVHAYSGEEALAKVQAARPAIDLILMDVHLGRGLDGIEAAQSILQDHDLPIVFLSSQAELEVAAKTATITSYGYVAKDSGSAVLAAAIRMAFRLHAAQQALQLAHEDLLQEITARRQAEQFIQQPSEQSQAQDEALRAGQDGWAKAAMALHGDKTFLDTLLDASYDTIFLFDPVSGRPLRWNRRFVEVSGYSDQEIAGLTAPAAFYDGSDLRKANEAIARILSEGHGTVELSLVTKEGRRIPFEYIATAVPTEAGQVLFLSIGRDITDRKRAEEMLQQRTQELSERVKELNCLYGLAKLVEESGDSIEALLRGVVELLPSAWRYPPIACARLTLDGQTFSTSSFQETPWLQQRPILVGGVQAGKVEVCYLEPIPSSDGGPFLRQEGLLLDMVAERLGKVVERIRARRALDRAGSIMQARLRLVEFADRHPLSELLQQTLDEVCAITDSPIGFCHFLAPDQVTISLQAWSTRTREEFCTAAGEGMHYPLEEAGVWADCIRQRQPVVHNDYAALPQRRGLPPGHAPVQRELVVPIFREGKIVAILGVGNKAQEYTENDVDLVAYFADVAWEIARRKRAEETLVWESAVNAAMAELGQALIAPVTMAEIANLVLGHALRVTGSAFGLVCHIDPRTGKLVCSTMTGEIWDQCEVGGKRPLWHSFGGLWGWVLDHRQPLLSNSPRSDDRASGTPHGHVPIEKFCAAPALLDDRLVGLVALANPGRDYTRQDLEVVEQLAQRYALAIQREQAAEALRQRTAELQVRNEDLNAFARTVAHDLKTPLTSIVGFSELVEADSTLSKEQRQEYMRAVAQQGRTMDNIINELLLLASVRREDVLVGPLDMARIVADVQQRVRDMAAQCQGEIVVPPEWPQATGYGPWVEEVWINYVSNALKYGGQPPRVELGASAAAGGTVRFWVRDNGAGLTEEQQEALFRPFARLDQLRARGHGLGLSIVQRIVEKLGGQVGAECDPGQGCTFWFTLPASSWE